MRHPKFFTSLLCFGLLAFVASMCTPPCTPEMTAVAAPQDYSTRPVVDKAPQQTRIEVARDSFRRGLIKGAQAAASKGEINRRDVLKIRIASLSPAFIQAAEDLCVVQMAFSGEDADSLPRTEAGDIDRAAIDWEGLAAFLERIIPLILQLIQIFGA